MEVSVYITELGLIDPSKSWRWCDKEGWKAECGLEEGLKWPDIGKKKLFTATKPRQLASCRRQPASDLIFVLSSKNPKLTAHKSLSWAKISGQVIPLWMSFCHIPSFLPAASWSRRRSSRCCIVVMSPSRFSESSGWLLFQWECQQCAWGWIMGRINPYLPTYLLCGCKFEVNQQQWSVHQRARVLPSRAHQTRLRNARSLTNMALPLPSGLAPTEVAFLCEMEMVTVIPRQRLESLNLLGVSISTPPTPPLPAQQWHQGLRTEDWGLTKCQGTNTGSPSTASSESAVMASSPPQTPASSRYSSSTLASSTIPRQDSEARNRSVTWSIQSSSSASTSCTNDPILHRQYLSSFPAILNSRLSSRLSSIPLAWTWWDPSRGMSRQHSRSRSCSWHTARSTRSANGKDESFCENAWRWRSEFIERCRSYGGQWRKAVHCWRHGRTAKTRTEQGDDEKRKGGRWRWCRWG